MPRKGTSKVTEAQRRAIAVGKASGRTHKQIAAATGLAVSTVDHRASDPRVATDLLRLKHKDRGKIERMWTRFLNRIYRDMASRDHVVSATARAQFLRLLPLGEPPLLRVAPADNSGGDFTLEELLITYRRATIEHGSTL